MSNHKPRLSLYQPALYQIKVLGYPDENWSDWVEDLAVSTGDDTGLPITELTGCVDQAALLGLLRRFYSLGMPLISVICLDVGQAQT